MYKEGKSVRRQVKGCYISVNLLTMLHMNISILAYIICVHVCTELAFRKCIHSAHFKLLFICSDLLNEKIMY